MRSSVAVDRASTRWSRWAISLSRAWSAFVASWFSVSAFRTSLSRRTRSPSLRRKIFAVESSSAWAFARRFSRASRSAFVFSTANSRAARSLAFADVVRALSFFDGLERVLRLQSSLLGGPRDLRRLGFALADPSLAAGQRSLALADVL